MSRRLFLPRLHLVPLIGALCLALSIGTIAVAQSSEGHHESLYERLGGLETIALVVTEFMNEFAHDELVMANPETRARKTPDALPYITYQVTTLVCQVTGGPCVYTGLEPGPAHEGLNVTEAEWQRMGEIFVGTLERHNVPQAEIDELVAIVGTTKDDIVGR